MASDDHEKRSIQKAAESALNALGAGAVALLTGTGISEAVGVAFVAGIVQHGGDVAALLPSGFPATARLIAAEDALRARALQSVQEPITSRMDARVAEGHEAGDVLRTALSNLRTWEEADRNADDERKRKMILAGLVNSFDREAYEAGITRRFFAIVDALDYGDLFLLTKGFDGNRLCDGIPDAPGWGRLYYSAGSMERYHLERLLQHGLVRFPPQRTHTQGDPGAGMDEEALGNLTARNAIRTVVGDRLAHFLRTPDQVNPVRQPK